MKRKYWIWTGVVVIVLAAVLMMKFGKDNTLKVAVESVTKRDLIETVAGSGKIYPETEVKISPDASGELISLFVKEGDRVNKGQVVAVIKSISTKSILNFTMPQAGINEMRETVKNINIYSPINGVVTGLFIRKGEKVVGTAQMMGTELMRIADLSTMKVDVNVSENEIQKIKVNDTARVKVEAYPDHTFKGVVTRISQTNAGGGFKESIAAMTDQVTNYTVSVMLLKESYEALGNKDNNFAPFRSGMSATAEIQTHIERQVLSVPINAVTTRQDEDSTREDENDAAMKEEIAIKEIVFVINDKNEAVQTEVKTAIQDDQFIQITSGLQEKQQVIVAPYSAIARTLKNKMKVKIVKRKELYQPKEE